MPPGGLRPDDAALEASKLRQRSLVLARGPGVWHAGRVDIALVVVVLCAALGMIALACFAALDAVERRGEDLKVRRSELARLQRENVELRTLLQEVERTSALAITTGDPAAHHLILERIQRQLPGPDRLPG